ncbi:GrpB family protein [Amaricoccus macauensis]|uniref:GrpB family protein n=1 Tax=Amaricoccus macauensis TaxID=57001 RepID=UPI003C7DEC44
MTGFVERARAERVEVVEYDPDWPVRFEEEAARLHKLLPEEHLGRIEHIGSTAVPGLVAKPIVDLAVEVPDLEHVRDEIAPELACHGYEFFWRPRKDGLPGIEYAWFIRRDAEGRRTHHVHMLTPGSPYWDRVTFRDWLRTHPGAAREYGEIKRQAAALHGQDRAAYARAKGRFIRKILDQAAMSAP